MAGRTAGRCAVWDSKYISQMGGDWSSAERGHYFNFNSCFSPKIHEYLAGSVCKPWNKPCHIFNEKHPCLNFCVWEQQGKIQAAPKEFSPPHSLSRAITCTSAFPSYSFWNKTGLKRLFSEKPSRRSAYFCGSFLQRHSNQFSSVFRANRISEIILDYSVHTCKLQSIPGILPVCACQWEPCRAALCAGVVLVVLWCCACDSPRVSQGTCKCRRAHRLTRCARLSLGAPARCRAKFSSQLPRVAPDSVSQASCIDTCRHCVVWKGVLKGVNCHWLRNGP